MLNICTLADHNFALKFLALRESIKKYDVDYHINLLCLDKKIFDSLNDRYQDITCHFIEDLMELDPQLKAAKDNKPSYEALNVTNGNQDEAKRMQFIWALASYYSWFCLKKMKLDDIMYIDTDIYFFNNPIALDDIKDFGSVGLIHNRAPYNPVNGKYNVGIIYFKNDSHGMSCVEFWKNCLLDQNNPFASEYGMCGDQKYLELFPTMFDKVFEIDEFIGHLAPWSINQHNFVLNKIIWKDKAQDLLFYHFSNFKCDFERERYVPAERHGIPSVKKNTLLWSLYEEYYECLGRLNEKFA